MEEIKNQTKVLILTAHYRITGDIAHFPDARLTDYMMKTKEFIAVTNAEVNNRDGTTAFAASFLNILRNHIEIILPVDEIIDDTDIKAESV